MSEVEQRPRLVIGGFGRHGSQWVNNNMFTYFPFSMDGLSRDSLYMIKYWLAYSVFSFPSDPCMVISG